MNRKALFVTLAITMLMMTYWLGAASAPTPNRSVSAVPQAMLSKGGESKTDPAAPLSNADLAGQVLLYEPARSANTRTVLDNPTNNNVGTFTSITIGADGLPLITYRNATENRLKVAHCDDLACATATISILSFGPARDNSLTIGRDGLGIVSLYFTTLGTLRVGHCVDVLCTSAPLITIDQSADVGQYNSIDIGADGFPTISYYDATHGDLKFADCDSITCSSATIRTLDSTGNVGQYTSMTRGAFGNPIISYYDVTNTHLKVLACADPECAGVSHRTIVDTEPLAGLQTSIALGVDDKPIIGYVEFDGGISRLKIGHCGDISCTYLDFKGYFNAVGTGINPSIAIGLDGIPMISNFHSINDTFHLVRCKSVDCSAGNYSMLLDSNNAGTHSSLTIGVDGLPIMSYFDEGSAALRTLHCGSPLCRDFQRRR